MTAEVAVLNRLGVALAADSAVTVGKKIHTSADKLFQLSEVAPVGAMIYASADFCSVPWETIIKLCRKDLGAKRCATLQEYVEHFFNFLRTQEKLFPTTEQDRFFRNFVADLFLSLHSDVESRSIEQAQQKGMDDIGKEALFAALVKDELATTNELEMLDEFVGIDLAPLRDKHMKTVHELKEVILNGFTMSEETDASLVNLVFGCLTRRRFGFGNHSGVVLAGFGEDEHYPQLYEIILEGMVEQRLRSYVRRTASISADMGSIIVPLAQREMVDTFIQGIDPALRFEFDVLQKKLVFGVGQAICAEVVKHDEPFGTELQNRVEAQIERMLETMGDQWQQILSRNSNPVLDIVASLPKDELAAIAESLVNLTKFKRRVSNEQETVGGPIDVALISKGDGFVWIKRKHYFDPSLNPRLIARYSGDIRE